MSRRFCQKKKSLEGLAGLLKDSMYKVTEIYIMSSRVLTKSLRRKREWVFFLNSGGEG